MKVDIKTILNLVLVLILNSVLVTGFDDILDHHEPTPKAQPGPLPKDKILFSDVTRLTFQRHKMTTSRRTHTIHQLSCVGGTAGCKLFKPDNVECEKGSFDIKKGTYNWKCAADFDSRVEFKHVEVICEGYDYPEDDYILLGSCGLEFTLDYKNPNDYHHNSYFKHMDEHERRLHQERLTATPTSEFNYPPWIQQLFSGPLNYSTIALVFVIALLLSTLTLRFLRRSSSNSKISEKRYLTQGSNFATTILSKKAC